MDLKTNSKIATQQTTDLTLTPTNDTDTSSNIPNKFVEVRKTFSPIISLNTPVEDKTLLEQQPPGRKLERFSVGVKNFFMGFLGVRAFQAAHASEQGKAKNSDRAGAFHIRFGENTGNVDKKSAEWANHGSWVGSILGAPFSIIGGILGAISGSRNAVGSTFKHFGLGLLGVSAFQSARTAERGQANEAGRTPTFHIDKNASGYGRNAGAWAEGAAWVGSVLGAPLAIIGGILGATAGSRNQLGVGIRNFGLSFLGVRAFQAAQVATRGTEDPNLKGYFHIRIGDNRNTDYNETSVKWANHGSWAGLVISPFAWLGGILGTAVGGAQYAIVHTGDQKLRDGDRTKIHVKEVLAYPHMNEAFRKHLEKELSIENYAFTESYANLLKAKEDPNISDDEFLKAANDIYRLFVRVGSEAEINISFSNRNKLMKQEKVVMNDGKPLYYVFEHGSDAGWEKKLDDETLDDETVVIDREKIAKAFYNSAKDIIGLMNDSHARFTQTEAFEEAYKRDQYSHSSQTHPMKAVLEYMDAEVAPTKRNVVRNFRKTQDQYLG